MIIGLGHESGVGKDTFAMFIVDYLRHRLDYLKLERCGFADKLYDVCHMLYTHLGFKSRQHYVNNHKDKDKPLSGGLTPRQILIKVGNKMREWDELVWISPLLNDQSGLRIIADVRKVNEFLILKKRGHTLIRIVKPGYVSTLESDVDLYPYSDQWDHTIVNDGNLNDLRDKAVKFVDEFLYNKLLGGQ